MADIPRRWIAVGALLGALGVALGAFGAHWLGGFLTSMGYAGEDLQHRTAIFETAVRYQMFDAFALVLAGLLLNQRDCQCWRLAGWAFLVGTALFSGFLYALALVGPNLRWFGAIVPLGGVLMIVGWVALADGALRRESSSDRL